MSGAQGASALPSGSCPSGQAPTGLDATRRDPSREQLIQALEPFAAMARVMSKNLIISGAKATDQSLAVAARGEAGQYVLTYGHFLDALELLPNAPGWGGMYKNPGIRVVPNGETPQ